MQSTDAASRRHDYAELLSESLKTAPEFAARDAQEARRPGQGRGRRRRGQGIRRFPRGRRPFHPEGRPQSVARRGAASGAVLRASIATRARPDTATAPRPCSPGAASTSTASGASSRTTAIRPSWPVPRAVRIHVHTNDPAGLFSGSGNSARSPRSRSTTCSDSTKPPAHGKRAIALVVGLRLRPAAERFRPPPDPSPPLPGLVRRRPFPRQADDHSGPVLPAPGNGKGIAPERPAVGRRDRSPLRLSRQSLRFHSGHHPSGKDVRSLQLLPDRERFETRPQDLSRRFQRPFGPDRTHRSTGRGGHRSRRHARGSHAAMRSMGGRRRSSSMSETSDSWSAAAGSTG